MASQQSANLHSLKFLFTDPPAKRPFLSKVERFPLKASALPGPGFYKSQEPINESFNSKGYGNSFVSKSHRFPDQIKNTGPGPGAYYQPNARAQNGIKTRNSAIFQKRGSKNRFTKEFVIPGPGVYNAKKAKKQVPAAKYVFSSQVDRLSGYKDHGGSPSPAHYDIHRDFEERERPNKNSPFFLIPSKEGKGQPKLLEEIKSFKSPSQISQSEPEIVKKDPKKRNLPRKASALQTRCPARKEGETKTPGPGAYLRVDVEGRKDLATGSVFKSESERKTNMILSDIGPGTYQNYAPLRKKNFHYNMNHGWV